MVLAVGPFGLGPMELVIILVILVMLFGASRLTDIGGSLGKGIKEFRKNIKDEEGEEAEAEADEQPVTSTATPIVTAQNGSETVAAVKCASCGSLNPAGARHCNQCGAAITATVP